MIGLMKQTSHFGLQRTPETMVTDGFVIPVLESSGCRSLRCRRPCCHRSLNWRKVLAVLQSPEV